MGWLRWLFLGDLGQQLDLADQKTEIETLRSQLASRHDRTQSSERRLDVLERENDEFKLYLALILRLLIAKKVTSAEEIKAMVDMVDREDGTMDKRFSGDLLPKA